MSDEHADAAVLLKAIEFAARKHSTQRRKDVKASPYINHPIAVAYLLADTGGITDLVTLMAAVLHDTIEDTETAPGELDEQFGPTVRKVVEEVTDDKSLKKEVRKQLQIEHAPKLARTILGEHRAYDRACQPPLLLCAQERTSSFERRNEVKAATNVCGAIVLAELNLNEPLWIPLSIN